MQISKIFNQETGKQFLSFVVTIMLSSVAYYFSTGVHNYWLLTWLAPIPLLVHALKASAISIIFASLITCFIGFSSSIFAYANTIIPVTVFIYGNIINAIIYTMILMLFRHMALRKEHWVWSFIFASGWTAFEFVTSRYSPAATVDSIAYTQVFNLPVIQISSVTGIWGITFLMMLVPASMALAWHYRKKAKLCLKTVAIPASILLLTLAFGAYRLHEPSPGATVKIGMAAIPMTMEEMRSRGQPQAAEKIIGRYVECVDVLSRSGAEIILLPEKIVALDLQQQANLLELLADTARKYQIMLIAGLSVQDGSALYNSAYLFLPSGEITLKYDKQHLLPFSEGRYLAGKELSVRDAEDKGLWGIAICKDMDFEEPGRGYGQAGINLLLVPALDFKTDALLHARVAIMRGVEENYAVARAAQWGLLSLSDNKGNIVKMAASNGGKNDVLLLDEIPLGQGKSIYSRLGNWFGYFSEGIFILLILFFLKLNKQKANEN